MKKLITSILFSKFICSPIVFFYKLLIFNNKINDLEISKNLKIHDKVFLQLILGKYESYEKYLIKKYLKDNIDVIDLGASIGVTSKVIAKKTNKKHIIVEMNPELIENLRLNFKKSNQYIYNLAVYSDSNNYISINEGITNKGSKIDLEFQKNNLKVQTINLSDLLSDNNINNYFLVCDIEGAETYFIYDSEALKNCNHLIIELHDNSFLGKKLCKDDLFNKIIDLGFKKIEGNGTVFYFNKI